MDPFLQLLLGQQSGSNIPDFLGLNEPEVDENGIPITVGNDITVGAPREQQETPRRPPLEIPERGSRQGRFVLNDDRVPPTREELKEILPRSGVFGTRGTLRDILGIVGDAFLVQEGANPVFQPQRQREKEGDALFGFSQDPLQAIERLATQNPELAAEVLKQYQQSQFQQGSLRSTQANRQDQAANRKEDNIARLVNLTARRLQAAGDDPAKIAFALELAQADAARNGITIEDLGISPELTDAERGVFAAGDMTVNQQVQVPFTERRVRATEQNAESQRISATRPRNPPPRPRAETRNETLNRFLAIPEADRTRDQQDLIDEELGRNRRRGRRGLGGTGEQNTSGIRIRSVRPIT